jgi:two-component system response regulator RegX3
MNAQVTFDETSPRQELTVLLIDARRSGDDPFIKGLEDEGITILLTHNGEEGIAILASGGIDLVLVSMNLQNPTGHALIHQITLKSRVPLVSVSDADCEWDSILALELGVVDCINNMSRIAECAARIRSAVGRTTYLLPKGNVLDSLFHRREVLHEGPVEIALGTGEVLIRGEPTHLRPRELAVLTLLVMNAGYIVTQDHILTEAWPDEKATSQKSLHVHVQRLRKVLELNPSNPRHILTIKGMGYRFDP